jgi:hypothetical protein
MSDKSGTFDIKEFADEIDAPTDKVGTKLLFENDKVKVWEIALRPGERAPFHRHIHNYFYVCVDPGRVRTRFPNGYSAEGDEDTGNVAFMEHSADTPGIHDLENTGKTTIRYTTVELLS